MPSRRLGVLKGMRNLCPTSNSLCFSIHEMKRSVSGHDWRPQAGSPPTMRPLASGDPGVYQDQHRSVAFSPDCQWVVFGTDLRVGAP